MFNRKFLVRAAMAAMALSITGIANAAVTYEFTATSALNSSPFGKFTFTVPNFVTGAVTIPAASLTSCSITQPTTGFTCGDQVMDTQFYNIAPYYETVAFTTHSTGTYYYFNAGSFATIGTHSSQIFGSSQFATLKVSGFAATPAIPEPATWGMMLFGFGLIGGVMRRREHATRLA